jgi:hypothetical protein
MHIHELRNAYWDSLFIGRIFYEHYIKSLIVVCERPVYFKEST